MEETTTNGAEDIHELARRLTRACQRAGLSAEQYGAKVRIVELSHFLAEEVECRPDDAGDNRWWWSWGQPIADRHDADRILTPDDIDELVAAIARVVAVPLKPQR